MGGDRGFLDYYVQFDVFNADRGVWPTAYGILEWDTEWLWFVERVERVVVDIITKP